MYRKKDDIFYSFFISFSIEKCTIYKFRYINCTTNVLKCTAINKIYQTQVVLKMPIVLLFRKTYHGSNHFVQTMKFLPIYYL